jgi:site-specific DNA-methyltransferase (adenine-specific)
MSMKKDMQSPRYNTNDDWETPNYIFDPLNKVFHFTLDTCANEINHKLPNYYTESMNGLVLPWDASSWCNPPYSQVREWEEKGHQESLLNRTSVHLLPARTGTQAYQQVIFPRAEAVCLLKQRIKFVGATAPARFDSALIVYSIMELTVEQLRLLQSLGTVLTKYKQAG